MTPCSFERVFAERTRGACSVFLASLPALAFAVSSPLLAFQARNAVPSPELGPAEVVRIQVEALRRNRPSNDGIALTYRFASPNNKRATGPLDRFTEMVRSPPYDRLINHLHAHFDDLQVSGGEASQRVVITDNRGEELAYLWVLSRQTQGEFKHCWMTDAVIPVREPVPRRLTGPAGLEQMAFSAYG